MTAPAPLRLPDHPYLDAERRSGGAAGLGSKFGRLDTREQVMACVNIVKRAGLDFLVLDQTRPDIEVPVVRVIVPGLRHFYRRFAPGRLYDVPVKLGWLDRPVPESDSIRFTPRPEVIPACARRGTKSGRRAAPATLCARLLRSRHARSARERRHRRQLRWLFGRLGKVQRERGGSRAGTAHRSAA